MFRFRLFSLTVFLALLALSAPARAWNDEGHRIIALIAEDHLTPLARQRVNALLAWEGETSMADVASWADHIRHETNDHPTHGVRIPLDHSAYNPRRDCSGPKLCAVGAVQQDVVILADPAQPVAARLEALKYIIHLTGDLHMPLHASQQNGGRIEVEIDGRDITLHQLWDGVITAHQGRSAVRMADRIDDETVPPAPISTDPVLWATESRDITRDVLMPGITRGQGRIALDDRYLEAYWPVVDARLHLAGLRLARVLNQALGQP